MSRLQFRDIQASVRHTPPHRCGAIRRIDYSQGAARFSMPFRNYLNLRGRPVAGPKPLRSWADDADVRRTFESA